MRCKQDVNKKGRPVKEKRMKQKEALAEIMLEHGIEWEQKGEHREHLSVLKYKREQRTQELAELEQDNERLRSKPRSYETVIDRNNLWSCFSRHRGKTHTRDEAR